MHMQRPGVIAIVLTGWLAVPPAQAQTPTDLADLVGARGAGGETQMQARGYLRLGMHLHEGFTLTFEKANVRVHQVKLLG